VGKRTTRRFPQKEWEPLNTQRNFGSVGIRVANPWNVNTYYKRTTVLLDDVDHVRQGYGRFSFTFTSLEKTLSYPGEKTRW